MQTLLLQSSQFSQDLFWLAGAAVVFVLAALYFRKILADRNKREAIRHDPRSHIVNDTNYNISREGIDGHRDQGLSETEAREAIENFKENGEIPTAKEFHELKRDVKNS